MPNNSHWDERVWRRKQAHRSLILIEPHWIVKKKKRKQQTRHIGVYMMKFGLDVIQIILAERRNGCELPFTVVYVHVRSAISVIYGGKKKRNSLNSLHIRLDAKTHFHWTHILPSPISHPATKNLSNSFCNWSWPNRTGFATSKTS